MPVTYTVIFTGPARAELIDAQEWYDGAASGLGKRFRTATDAVMDRMSANPMQFPVIYRNVRRALLQRFPYALLFVVDDKQALTVIACFHGSRDQTSWQKLV